MLALFLTAHSCRAPTMSQKREKREEGPVVTTSLLSRTRLSEANRPPTTSDRPLVRPPGYRTAHVFIITVYYICSLRLIINDILEQSTQTNTNRKITKISLFLYNE